MVLGFFIGVILGFVCVIAGYIGFCIVENFKDFIEEYNKTHDN